MRRPLLAFALLVAPFAVAGKPDPAAVQFRDDALATPSSTASVPATSVLEARPWAVGQWTLYRHTDRKGRVSVQRLSVVRHDDCGWWVETTTVDAKTRQSTVKVCYREAPTLAATAGETTRRGVDQVQVMITIDGGDPEVLDFRTPEGEMLRGMMAGSAGSMLRDWDLDLDTTEPVTVHAGTFDGAIRGTYEMRFAFLRFSGTGYVHGAIPLNGTLRFDASDGSSQELLAYGETGAASLYPDVWAP
jgi:hypothetical protein